MNNKSPPSDSAILERAKSLGNIACFTVDLQCQRLKVREPLDSKFILRPWMDFQFLIIALFRLRRAAELARRVSSVKRHMRIAIKEFDEALPKLSEMRNVAEHMDDYAVDNPNRQHKNVSRHSLQVGSWSDNTFHWLDNELNVDDALKSAIKLFRSIRESLQIYIAEQEGNSCK